MIRHFPLQVIMGAAGYTHSKLCHESRSMPFVSGEEDLCCGSHYCSPSLVIHCRHVQSLISTVVYVDSSAKQIHLC
ncbi:hypothetical protein MANES_07G082310v8 [Manihot esculenta]|uniref:Uncharacterized protein n=2 Tax=Manihot esculenta TaxID=3983 RepID=A0ACB7HEK7_MANES|nr:hypothetical protein MANES_07G082310v8 [Manihot esculenta]KAG8650950.1 hypothetical protein MANES_07G082310v8 [Manihot esculenta]